MNIYRTSLIGVGLAIMMGCQIANGQSGKQSSQIERGRYVVMIGGCNDCHTAGYGDIDAKTPEHERLEGDTLGYRGPWGTTYPTNLRISIGKKTEEQWVRYAKTLKTRPPMPWFNVQAMSDADLRALYQYVKSLGVSGKAAPAFVPAGQQPKGQYVLWPGVK
ncbi:MAG TPA: c-type cytochrome [Bryobacteraceae bacterium]|nr:c-type cytochrome [Bryobacteraceae bacterium]